MQVIYHTTTEEKEELEKSYRPPKNIRQVGNPGAKRKIYIEDYVVTYLAKLAMPSNTYSRGAILLGNLRKTEEGVFIFISGALESQNFELDLDETIFTNENWADIYNQIREFFPDLSIVGWFVSRLGFSTELNGKIIQTHNNYFAGENKVLYMIDSLEDEDAFYLYENNGLKKQKGYYIYYEKNEEMQSYMIAKGNESKPKTKENANVIRRDQAVLASYRKTLEKRTMQKEKDGFTAPVKKWNKKRDRAILKKQESGFYYVASTFLTVAILAVGITIINNYDKMVLLESVIQQMTGETREVIADTPKTDDSTSKKENKEESSTKQEGENSTEVQNHSKETSSESLQTGNEEDDNSISDPEKAGQAELISNQNTNSQKNPDKKIKTTTNSIATYYIVKEGDTIISISKKMFKSPKYAKRILEANEMKEEEPIFPGQKIIIPALN